MRHDELGRRTEIARSGARMTESRSDVYGYNDRSELTNAVKNATLNEYAYQYDDIGNRLASLDLGDSRVYQANSLNQYTSISNAASTAEAFVPQFDLDRNQTLVRTTTGDWSVTYNGENRPVSWSCGGRLFRRPPFHCREHDEVVVPGRHRVCRDVHA